MIVLASRPPVHDSTSEILNFFLVKSLINDLGSYDDYVAFTQTDLSNVMQDRYGVIVMRCEQTHRVSSMLKPKPRPEPDFG